MFQVQHEALREAQREIDRMAAQRRYERPEAERRGAFSLAGLLGRVWPRRAAGQGVELQGVARGVAGDERGA